MKKLATKNNEEIDALAKSIKALAAVQRRTRKKSSKLDRHMDDLMRLLQLGLNGRDLQRYLQSKPIQLFVSDSTVTRWIKKNGLRPSKPSPSKKP